MLSCALLSCPLLAQGPQEVGGRYIRQRLDAMMDAFGATVYYDAEEVERARGVLTPVDRAKTAAAAAQMLTIATDLTVVAVDDDEFVVVRDEDFRVDHVSARVAAAREFAGGREERVASQTASGGVTRVTPADSSVLLVDNEPLFRAFDRIGERYGVKVYYHPDHIPYFEATVVQDGRSLYRVLTEVTRGTELLIVKYAEGVWVVAPANRQSKAYADDVVDGWRTGRYRSLDAAVRPTLARTLGTAAAGADTAAEVTVSGVLTDDETDEPLFGAILYHPATERGTTTDLDGAYSLTLPRGEQFVEARMLGYETQPLRLDVRGPADDLDFRLYTRSIGFDEVVVSARSGRLAATETVTGVTRLAAADLKAIPISLGDLDVLKVLTTTAGVSSTSEASSGISVRGGALDQNYVLQAGMPLLFPAHALGFYPIFHPDLVSGVTLHKGYVPPRLGGRATSVIEVDWKTGDMQRWHADGAVGILSGRLAVEGPIVKDKLSVIVGGRLSYLDYVLKNIRDGNVARSSVGFADVSARLTYRWTGGQLDGLGAYTADDFRFAFRFGYTYTNTSFSLRLRQRLRERLYATASVTRSAYDASREDIDAGFGPSRFTSGLTVERGEVELTSSQIGELELRGGLSYDRYLTGGRTEVPIDDSPVEGFSFSDPSIDAAAAFAQASYPLTPELRVEGGLRLVRYVTRRDGASFLRYDGPAAIALRSERVDGGEDYAHPLDLQPRANVVYAPTDSRFTFGAGYTRAVQFVHQLSSTVAPTPLDVFYVASESVPLTRSDGVSVSAAMSPPDRRGLGLEVGAYYRTIENQLLARQGRLLRATETPEQGIYQAPGEAYGVETTVRLKGLYTNLQVSYGYGRSFVDVDRRYPEMALVRGERIPAFSDLPHQVNVNYSYTPSGRASFNVAWVFTSGRPFTAVDGVFPQNGARVPIFANYNGARLPPTHRLDLGFGLDNRRAKRKGFRAGFLLSVYNLYQRQNPFLAYYAFRPGTTILTPFQFSVIGDVIPTVKLTFQWD